MKAFLVALSVCLCCVVTCTPFVQAKGQAKTALHKPIPQRAVVYHLTALPLADSAPTRYVWVVYDERGSIIPEGEGAVYESLDSPTLRSWVSHLPAGTNITTGVSLNLNNPVVPAPKKSISRDPDEWGVPGLKDFAHFCRGKGMHFIIYGVSA